MAKFKTVLLSGRYDRVPDCRDLRSTTKSLLQAVLKTCLLLFALVICSCGRDKTAGAEKKVQDHPFFKGEFSGKDGSKKIYKGEFFAELFIVSDSSKLEDLKYPKHYREHKQILKKHRVKYGEPGQKLYAALLIAGAGLDKSAKSNLTADFYLSSSKYSRANHKTGVPVWTSGLVEFPEVVLGSELYPFYLDKFAADESYTVHAVVRDGIRGVSMALQKVLKVKKESS